MKRPLRWLVVVLLGFPGTGWGAGSTDTPAAASDPVIEQAVAAHARRDWPRAAQLLGEALRGSPDNAEYHNLYAYSLRNGPAPDMDRVFRHYAEALRLDPRHRGAHEYAGEAYLLVGNLARAREHLAALDRLCFFGCEEYSELKQKIAAYEARQAR